jgi:hypothetical protein
MASIQSLLCKETPLARFAAVPDLHSDIELSGRQTQPHTHRSQLCPGKVVLSTRVILPENRSDAYDIDLRRAEAA